MNPRKKFAITYPIHHPDQALRGKRYRPEPKKMVVMNEAGIFFEYDGRDYYPSIRKLCEVLPAYDVVWHGDAGGTESAEEVVPPDLVRRATSLATNAIATLKDPKVIGEFYLMLDYEDYGGGFLWGCRAYFNTNHRWVGFQALAGYLSVRFEFERVSKTEISGAATVHGVGVVDGGEVSCKLSGG